MQSISEFDLIAMRELLGAWGFKPSHAPRLLRAYYQSHGRLEFDQLELGESLRQRIERELTMMSSSVLTSVTSDDGTQKLLVVFAAGGTAEAVLMPAYRAGRAAACVSSQIGCAMGCDFCASTRGGLQRSLSSGEIVQQFLHLQHAAAQLGRRIRSLVFMGMGEPMHNLENVCAAIDRIAAPGLGELGWRNITVSTVGVVSGIEQLAHCGRRVALAVSLHAPDDETRGAIVPTGRRWKIADIIAAAKQYAHVTGTIVTIEYCMLDGVNDSPEQAQQLAELLRGFRAHVNLIPYNWIGRGVSGREYRQPSRQRMEQFAGILSERGVVTHFRRTRGDDVAAACGQLREREMVQFTR